MDRGTPRPRGRVYLRLQSSFTAQPLGTGGKEVWMKRQMQVVKLLTVQGLLDEFDLAALLPEVAFLIQIDDS